MINENIYKKMKLKKTVTEVARNFSEFLNTVRYKHDTIVLIRGKKEVAELRPILSGISVSNFRDLLHSLPHIPKEDSNSFGDDLKEIRDSFNEDKLRDPWE